MRLKIGNKYIGDGEKPYFIADIAANHDGDLNRAFKLIELAKEAGADCAKFQNFKADTIVSRDGFKGLGKQLAHQSSWKKSVYEVYKDASLNEEWTHLLKEKCDEVGIEYMTTPYNLEVVDLVDPFVNAYKIGSGDITWSEMLATVASKNKVTMLATGASYIEEVDRAVNFILDINSKLVLMQCNTNYTASSDNYRYVNISVLEEYKKRYPNAVLGLSDHTFGHATVLGAMMEGACVFEKHFTDDNDRVGPDHKFSMNPKTWREMVDEANNLFLSIGDGEKKLESNEFESVTVQRRGFYLKVDKSAGDTILEGDIIALRPMYSDGIEPWDKKMVVGKTIKHDMRADTHLSQNDLE